MHTNMVFFNRGDYLYNDSRVSVSKYEMKTLRPSLCLNCGIVSAWSSHLNYREMLKSVESPSRYFFTTYPTVIHYL